MNATLSMSPISRMPETSPVPARSDEVALGDLLGPLLAFYARFGRRLLLVALLIAVLAMTLAAFNPRQQVTATLDTPQLSLELWRSLLPVLTEERAIAGNLAAYESLRGKPVLPALPKLLARSTFWTNQVQFRMALRRDDLRDAPAADLKAAGPLGVEIAVTAPSEEDGAEAIEAIVFHIREAALRLSLQRYLTALDADIGRQRADFQLGQVRAEFEIEQQGRRLADLRRLLQNYPEARQINMLAIAPSADGAGRFLPPVAQLMALEVSMSETRNGLRAISRNLEKYEWIARYLDAVREESRGFASGSALLGKLRLRREALLAESGTPSGAVLEAALELERNFSERQAQVELWQLKAQPGALITLFSWRLVQAGLLAFVAAFAVLSVAIAVATRLTDVRRRQH